MKNIIFYSIFILTFFVANTYAFDIPFLDKKYETIEECKRFTPKVSYQDSFVNDVCNTLFDTRTVSPKLKTRLLCLRNEINSATTVNESRNAIFKCYEKFPSTNQNLALSIAQYFFKTQEELAREQITNQQQQRQIRPAGLNCMIIGIMIDCI